MIAGTPDSPHYEMTLTDVELNPDLADEAFTFTPPDGVQVIDLIEDMRGYFATN